MNYYFNNAMRLEGDLMSRGKEVKELREKMGMNRREFSDYYGIPYRTVQDWEAEKRELPEYLLRLMKYRAEVEYMMKSKS
ncbi:helix-turn-helix domain-containing protein [Dorea amylophila]|jgi:putative transcriptional regulator|uniref:Putative zinc finger/helix-turn-helix protein, YgiT family n=1 Tax=Dorea longicatena TaxID=88431 RepID=A0A174Q4X8_9FIRM|nr:MULTISPECIES: helix-turn-helix domain-containing protein [Dorea]MCU6741324.1 helix-turn-helix domain-containing protein [Dorea amylophila]CUP65745.1 putative zinc finger/helix-turn-helix protein%2C YgiT family [Dorea longicatena]